jgi:hypothetical protein
MRTGIKSALELIERAIALAPANAQVFQQLS